jgi:hypothetical protein
MVYHPGMIRFFRRYSPRMWAFLALALAGKALIVYAIFG